MSQKCLIQILFNLSYPHFHSSDPKIQRHFVTHPSSSWGAFMGFFGCGLLRFLQKGVTLNSARCQNMLRENLLPIFKARKMKWFLQDSVPCQSSKSIKVFLTNNQIRFLPLQENSPDLNPTDNLQLQMKERVDQKEPTSYRDLNRKLIEDKVIKRQMKPVRSWRGPCQPKKHCLCFFTSQVYLDSDEIKKKLGVKIWNRVFIL